MNAATTRQVDRWAGEFGAAYTQRNAEGVFTEVHIESIRSLFAEAFESGGIRPDSALEVGCNTGHNSLALQRLGVRHLVGIDPQPSALAEGMRRGVPARLVRGSAFGLPFPDRSFDLVFAIGVLMHISLEDLPKALTEMTRVSRTHLLSLDYFQEEEAVVEGYHGHDDMLWRRDMRKVMTRVVPGARLIWTRQVSVDGRTGYPTMAFAWRLPVEDSR